MAIPSTSHRGWRAKRKNLNCVIAASAEAVHAAGVKVETGIHDTIRVKGRVEPVEVYEILDIGV